jgi:hypothetical protein
MRDMAKELQIVRYGFESLIGKRSKWLERIELSMIWVNKHLCLTKA